MDDELKEDPNGPRDIASRLATIHDRLAAYEAEQRELLGDRAGSESLTILPGEDICRVERAHKMVKRGYLMGPPADESTVAAFEAGAGIELPGDYQRFILEVGNGGEGPPAYGLLPLGATPAGDVPDDLQDGYSDLLSKPFPFVEHWIWDGEEPSKEADARLETVSHGNLILGHDGCGMYWTLVVSGDQKGRVWQLTDIGIAPCAPSLTFLDWYEYWLEGGDDWWRDLYPAEEADGPAEPEELDQDEPPPRPWWNSGEPSRLRAPLTARSERAVSALDALTQQGMGEGFRLERRDFVRPVERDDHVGAGGIRIARGRKCQVMAGQHQEIPALENLSGAFPAA